MNKSTKIILAVIGACSVIMDILTPIAIALFWGYFFNLSSIANTFILIIGGLGSIFRGIKVGWMRND